MNAILEEALTGDEPVTVTLGGKEYPLAFPLHACALYQAETAKLDRARRAAHGPLTPAVRQALKKQRRELLRQSDALQEEIAELSRIPSPESQADDPGEEENSPAVLEEIANKTEQFYELLGEAMRAKNQLEEDAARGDSLFFEGNWFKITSDDPERVVLALWAGLHAPVNSIAPNQDPKWLSPFTVGQLQKLVDPSNAEEVIEAISKALQLYSVKKKQRQTASRANGNGATKIRTMPSPSESPSSGPSPASTSDSPNSNS